MSQLLDLPFDQYQRYRLVSELVGPLSAERGRLRALEIGGRTGLLRAFMPEARVELVDVEPSDEPGLVLGDGSRLPFQDGSFDLVAACDTLEHVPPAQRDDFVRECCRVSRGWVVLAGPYDSPEVRSAEGLLQTFLSEKLSLEHRYLDEHRDLGLPDLERTRELLAEAAEEVVIVAHGNLQRWLALLSTSMYLEADPHLRGLARAYYRFYNSQLYASDHAAPVYRHALVACRAGSPRPSVPSEAQREPTPARALEPFQWLLQELTAFDRRREIYETERANLNETIATLEADLEGHRTRLKETDALLKAEKAEHELLNGILASERAERESLLELLKTERAEFRAVQQTLETDLEGHARSLDDLRALLEQQRALAAEQHTQAEAQRVEADQQLERHRALIEAQGREAESLRSLAEELTRELGARYAHQAELEANLEAVNALAAEVNEALRREHAENLELRAELRSRARNLLRVLTPRQRAM